MEPASTKSVRPGKSSQMFSRFYFHSIELFAAAVNN